MGQSEWVHWLQKQKQAWEVGDQDLEAHYNTTEFEDFKEWLQGDRERRMAGITADREAKKAVKRAQLASRMDNAYDECLQWLQEQAGAYR